MAVATSPYSQNDYQAASNFRPYQLPINAIAQAISAQNKFWEDGAARVKSVYDNALNLQLSLEPNKEIRQKFMEDADKQLTKLSSMDLSDPSVQRQGFNIYKPLFQDEGILYDDAMTRHYGKVRNDALSYRDKDNGKEYSDTNLAYALDGYSDFVNSKDRMAGKKFYQNRKEYVPYYDYTTEANVALKNCHPNEVTKASAQGLDIVTYSEKGLSSAKLNGCLGTLSDKAKKQLSIDGYVTYKNNPLALRDAYVPTLQNTKSQLDEENAAYNGILANKDKLSSLSEDQLQKIGMTKDVTKNPDLMDVKLATKDFLTSLDQKKTANQLRIDNLNKTIGQLVSSTPDLSSISGENFEPVAGAMYSKGYMDAYSAAHSYVISDQKRVGNPSQMLIYREDRQDLRQEDQQSFLKDMEKQKAEDAKQLQLEKNKLTNKNAPFNTTDAANHEILKSAFSGDVTKLGGYDAIQQERNDIAVKRADLKTNYYYKLKSWAESAGQNMPSEADFHSQNAVWQNWYKGFYSTLPKDDPKWTVIHQFEDAQQGYILDETLAKNTQDQVDAIIKKQAPGLFNKDFLNKFKPVNGVNPADIQAAIEGTPTRGDIQIKDVPYSTTSSGSMFGTTVTSAGTEKVLFYKGKRIDPNSDLGKLYHNIYQANDVSNNDLANKRNQLAAIHTIVQKQGYQYPELDIYDKEDVNNFKGKMLQTLGLNAEEAQKAITIGQTDLRGGLEITIHPDESNSPKWDASQILNQFKNNYGVLGDLTPVEGKGSNKYHFVINVPELDKFNSPELQAADRMTPYLRSLESNVDARHPIDTGLLRSQSDPTKLYGIKITAPLVGGGYNYEVYTQDGNTIGYYDNRTQALQVLNRNIERK